MPCKSIWSRNVVNQLTPLLWRVLSSHLRLNLITQILIMNLNLHQSQRICHKMENYICFQMHRPPNQIQNQWMCRCTKKNICVWIQGNHQRKKHRLAIFEMVLLKRKLNLQIFHRSSKRSLKMMTITMMTILWKTTGFKKNFDMHWSSQSFSRSRKTKQSFQFKQLVH